MRVLVLAICLGACAVENDNLPVRYAPLEVDAGVSGTDGCAVGTSVDTNHGPTRNLDLDSRGVGVSDLASAVSSISDAGTDSEVLVVDTQGNDAHATSCVQRAIDNGYASCAPSDPYYASCALCAGGEDPTIVARCKSTIDCLLKNVICDEACMAKCIGVPADGIVRMCVYKVVTPFCGVQLWKPDAVWGCKKAL